MKYAKLFEEFAGPHYDENAFGGTVRDLIFSYDEGVLRIARMDSSNRLIPNMRRIDVLNLDKNDAAGVAKYIGKWAEFEEIPKLLDENGYGYKIITQDDLDAELDDAYEKSQEE